MDGRTSKADRRQESDAKRSDTHTSIRTNRSDETVRRIEHDITEAAKNDPRFSVGKGTDIWSGGYNPHSGGRSTSSASGFKKMKGLYIFLFSGIIISFILTIAATVALFYPTNISPNDSIKAIPVNASAGALMSYKINGCDEGKHTGTTSVNIQSVDVPPSITVAVAAPSPQTVHCQNALLIPQPLPTGDYKVIVYIRYSINPVRDLLMPVERKYTSNIIHITNLNPNFVLPTVSVDTSHAMVNEPSANEVTTTQPIKSPERISTQNASTKKTGLIPSLINSITDITNVGLTNLLGGK